MSIERAEEDNGLTLDQLETYWPTWTDTMKRKLQELEKACSQDNVEAMQATYTYLDGYVEAVGDVGGPWDDAFVQRLMDALWDWNSLAPELAEWIRKQHV